VTEDQLVEHVWAQLPSRKYVLGRRKVQWLVHRAVKQWPTYVLQHCDAGESQVVGKYLARSLKRQAHEQYGMGVILTIVLGAMISELVKILLRWWLESDRNRGAMMELTR